MPKKSTAEQKTPSPLWTLQWWWNKRATKQAKNVRSVRNNAYVRPICVCRCVCERGAYCIACTRFPFHSSEQKNHIFTLASSPKAWWRFWQHANIPIVALSGEKKTRWDHRIVIYLSFGGGGFNTVQFCFIASISSKSILYLLSELNCARR